MRSLAALFVLAAVLSGCSKPSPGAPSGLPTENLSISGKVVERLDEAPYTYLRLETPAGPAWAAVGGVGGAAASAARPVAASASSRAQADQARVPAWAVSGALAGSSPTAPVARRRTSVTLSCRQ